MPEGCLNSELLLKRRHVHILTRAMSLRRKNVPCAAGRNTTQSQFDTLFDRRFSFTITKSIFSNR